MICIALGNSLRGDDGVAQAAVAQLRGCSRLTLLQLTPEVAAELAGHDVAVFVDADAEGSALVIEPVTPSKGMLLHSVATPDSVVALARELYGFEGAAYLCRIPVRDFALRESLSPHGEQMAAAAARLLAQFTATSST